MRRLVNTKKCSLFLGGLLIGLLCTQAYAFERFINNGDGTVSDELTELIWIRDPNLTPGVQGGMIWLQARNACSDLVYAGVGPKVWRLPTIDELQSLVDENNYSPSIDTRFFATVNGPYWSSTEDMGSGPRAWTVNFINGRLESHSKLNLLKPVHLPVRCVRSGK